jgi:glycosyltransferase involved in cell wall biosynthesis
MDDLISVVMPAYNVSRYIGSALQSVLDQTYKNFEIIVVDDCSTDDTAGEIRKFKDKVRYVRHEVNQGVSATRNTGIDQSRGSIVAFLDADDKWAPEKLEIFAESFSKNPAILYAFSDFSRFKWKDGAFFALSNSQIFPTIYEIIQGQKYFNRRIFVIPRSEMFKLFLKEYPVYPSAVVVRKPIFKLIGTWDKTLRTNEDFDFGLRCCRVTDGIYIDERLSMIGRHETNLSFDLQRMMEGDISVFDIHLKDPYYGKKEIELIKYYKGRRLCGHGHTYMELGKYKQAAGKYREAMRSRQWFLHALLRIGYLAVRGRWRNPESPSSNSSRITSR